MDGPVSAYPALFPAPRFPCFHRLPLFQEIMEENLAHFTAHHAGGP
jgi:hypothetical protein